MFLITKWWFALPVDGPDKLYWGFPFPFMGEGFHTSMSYQFFVIEFIVDFAIYVLVWTLLLFILSKSLENMYMHKVLSKIIWSLAIVLIVGFSFYMRISNPMFHIKRSYDWNVLQTGYIFIWQTTPRPDISQFQPLE